MNEYVLGMDIGGTNIRVGAQKKDGLLEHFLRVPRREVMVGENPTAKLAEFIANYCQTQLKDEKVSGMAIGFPSILSRDRRTVLQTPNIRELDNVAVADLLEERLHFPILLEKDVNLLFLNDMKTLHIPDAGIHIGVYIGTGVGNSICINGMPLVGKDGVAGELGHLANIGGTKQCGCGNIGCSECYAAGWHLQELYEEHFSDVPMHDLFIKYGDAPILAEFVDAIACVVATEVNILNPDSIVMGGGVINMTAFPKEMLEARIKAHSRKPYPAENLSIFYATDSVESGVRGALIYASKQLQA